MASASGNVVPHENDVLFGRGFTISAHPGNERLRAITQSYKPAFLKARKKEKRVIGRTIVDEIGKSNPPGRFLTEDLTKEVRGYVCDEILGRSWLVVGTEKAVEKVMHRLREKEKPAVRQRGGAQPEKGPMSASKEAASKDAPPRGTADHGLSMEFPQPQSLASGDAAANIVQRMQQINDNGFAGGGDHFPQHGQFNSQFTNQFADSNNLPDGNLNQQSAQLFGLSSCLPKSIQSATGMNQSIQIMNSMNQSMQTLNGMNQLMQSASGMNQSIQSVNNMNQSIQSVNDMNQSIQNLNGQQDAPWSVHQNDPTQRAGPLADIGGMLEPRPSGSPIYRPPSAGSQSAASEMSGIKPIQVPIHRSSLVLKSSASVGSDRSSQLSQPASRSSSFRMGDGSPMLQSNSPALPSQAGSNPGPFIGDFSSAPSMDPSLSAGGPSSRDPEVSEIAAACVDPPIDLAEAASGGVDGFDALVDSVFDPPASTDNPARFDTSTTAERLGKERREVPAKNQSGLRAVTLRRWIDGSDRQFGDMADYVQSATSVALELARFLLNHSSAEGATAISPARIAVDNAIVFVASDESNAEAVDRVEITTSADERPSRAGDVAPRLRALGVVLYEVFSREAFRGPPPASTSVGGLSLTRGLDEDEPSEEVRRSKRPQRASSRSASGGDARARLEALGLPQSVCAVVGDLLDCSDGDFRGDDAYRSLADVLTDLKLMRDDAACFLHDLQFSVNPSFEIRPKFYGRDEETAKIVHAYSRQLRGECAGMVVRGGAGVGKSSLVSYVTRKLAAATGLYFLDAKFDQSKNINPLYTIGGVFNALCDGIAQEADPSRRTAIAKSLEAALGSQAGLLLGSVPSLAKLTSCSALGTSDECVDAAASMRYLFGKLLEVLSEYKGVAILLDDLQWADSTSRMLIASMMSNTKGGGKAFFACCYRDDELQAGDSFASWLGTIEAFPLERLHVQNMSKEGVNELVSETLHLFPRITRPLTSVLHYKTRGNPLFLRQLLEMLHDQGYISLSVSPLHWTWDLDKITDLEISDDVLGLMMKEMRRLPADLQLGLKMASCLGSSAKYAVIDILSQDIGLNLRALLDRAVQRGFMVKVDETCVRFSHDKIQQAAYETIPSQERLENHMRFGLAICSHALNNNEGNDDLFFAAINQINRGGADSLPNPNQKVMVAALNLKAGRRSIELSDFSTALKLFEHGISFLDREERWTDHYNLSLDLFDGAVEMACAVNDMSAVRKFSGEVVGNAKCDDDKLNCLYAVAKSLRLTFKFVESKKVAFSMLDQLGERMPRPNDDDGFAKDVEEMKVTFESKSDESILNMKETDQGKRDVLLMNLYQDLCMLLTFIDAKRVADVGLRMTQISISNGLCCMSPVALAQFATVLVNRGDAALGYRVSRIALRLLKRIDAKRYTSVVVYLVGAWVSWVSEPLQSISESHLVGFNQGQRGGDVLSANLNYSFYLQIIYISVQNLSIVREKIRAFALELLQRKQQFMIYGMRILYLQTLAFMEGLDFEEEEGALKALPSWDTIVKSSAGKNSDFLLLYASHQCMRAVLFKRYDKLPQNGLLDCIMEKNVPMRPMFYYGIFYEALTSFHLMRQTNGDGYHRKGEAALMFMRKWSKCNQWNFENKYLLLEAEMMRSSGYHEQAAQLYEQSILSANKHKFVHEEAIACEAAATFYYERGLHQKAYPFFMRSVHCYKKWGAMAIASRVEQDIQIKLGMNTQSGPVFGPVDVPYLTCLTPKEGSSKRSAH